MAKTKYSYKYNGIICRNSNNLYKYGLVNHVDAVVACSGTEKGVLKHKNYELNRCTNNMNFYLKKNVSKETAAKGRGYNFDVLRAKLLYRNEAAQPAKFAFIEEVDVVNSKHIKPFNSSNIPIDNVIVVSAGTHIGKLHELLEQDIIFSPTDGKHRVKFVDGKTPHFKQYKGDILNE